MPTMKPDKILSNDYRFSLILDQNKRDGNKLFRIDHQTGQTWSLMANIWVPVVEPKTKTSKDRNGVTS